MRAWRHFEAFGRAGTRLWAVCALVAALMPGMASAQSLVDVVRSAIANSDALAADRAELDALREQRIQVNTQRRATIQGEVSGGVAQDTNRVRGFRGASDYLTSTRQPGTVGLSASQPVYTGGRLDAAARESDLRLLQAEARLRQSTLAVARNAAIAYADLAREQSVSGVVEASVVVLAEEVRASRARFDAGDVSITDVAQSEARLAAAQAQAATARGRVQSALAAFERVVGQPPQLIDASPVPPPIPPTLDEALARALTDNPELRAARLSEQISTAAARSAEAQRNPVVILQGSVAARSDAQFDGSAAVNSSVEARMTVPLWTGGSNPSRVREQLARANAARLDARDLERDITARVTQAWSEIQAGRENVRAADAQVTAAELARRGAEAEQRFGLRSTIEALNQEQELRQARLAAANARRDLFAATANLLLAIGRSALDPLAEEAASDAVAPPASAMPDRNARPEAWEEPLIRVQRQLERRDRSFIRGVRAVQKAIGPEQ